MILRHLRHWRQGKTDNVQVREVPVSQSLRHLVCHLRHRGLCLRHLVRHLTTKQGHPLVEVPLRFRTVATWRRSRSTDRHRSDHA